MCALHLRRFGSCALGLRLLWRRSRTFSLSSLDRRRWLDPAGRLLRTLDWLPLRGSWLDPAGLLDLRFLFPLGAFFPLRLGSARFLDLFRRSRFRFARRGAFHFARGGFRLGLKHFRLLAAPFGIHLPDRLGSHLALGLGLHFRRRLRLAPAFPSVSFASWLHLGFSLGKFFGLGLLLRGTGRESFRWRFAFAGTIRLPRDDRRAVDLHAGGRSGGFFRRDFRIPGFELPAFPSELADLLTLRNEALAVFFIHGLEAQPSAIATLHQAIKRSSGSATARFSARRSASGIEVRAAQVRGGRASS